MTSTRLRWLVLAWVAAYVWWWSFPYGAFRETAAAKAALEHSGQGAIIPPSETIGFLFLFGVLASATGLFFQQRWGRWALIATTLTSIVLGPFMGIGVFTPFDGTIGYISALLQGAVLAASMRTPAPSREDEGASVTVYETTDPAKTPVVHSLLHNAGIATAAKFTVQPSDAIVAKDVLELNGGN